MAVLNFVYPKISVSLLNGEKGHSKGKEIFNLFSFTVWLHEQWPRAWREMRGKLLQDYIISVNPGMSSHFLAA